MIVASWKIETDYHGTRRWFWVRVYDSLAALHRGAARYSRHNGGNEGVRYFAGAVACVQRVAALHSIEDPEHLHPIWPDNGLAGVVRLERDHLYSSVIHHEVVHAAAIVYRMDVASIINLGDGFVDLSAEEAFAYIHGELAADMDSGLRRLAG